MFRLDDSDDAGQVEVLLGHPGGPFWAKRDDGAWSIPKGEYDVDESPRDAAAREFAEEVGVALPAGREIDLGTVRLPSGKRLTVYAIEADLDPTLLRSNTFEIEWPPRSGRIRSFPEFDRLGWFAVTSARTKLSRGQDAVLDRLVTALDGEPGS